MSTKPEPNKKQTNDSHTLPPHPRQHANMHFFIGKKPKHDQPKDKEAHRHVHTPLDEDICNKHGNKRGFFTGQNHKFTNRYW